MDIIEENIENAFCKKDKEPPDVLASITIIPLFSAIAVPLSDLA